MPETIAVIYGAKSSPDEKGSVDSQHAECRAYAERNGWTIAEPVYGDENASAYKGSRGPGLAAAKSHAARLAAAGDVKVVLLAFATDRLARGDGKQAAHLVEHVLEANGAHYRIATVSDDLGGDEMMAVVLGGIYGMRAHADSKAKGAHVKRGQREAAARGHYIAAHPPYGYAIEGKRDERRLVVIPEQAATLRRIADEILAGISFSRIAEALSADGVPTPRGKVDATGRPWWERSSIERIFDNPVYAGFIRWGKGDAVEVFGPFDTWETIFTVDEWREIQTERDRRRADASRRGRLPSGGHLLARGLLRCGHAVPPCPGRHGGSRPAGWVRATGASRTTGIAAASGATCRTSSAPRHDAILASLDDFVFDREQTRERLLADVRGAGRRG